MSPLLSPRHDAVILSDEYLSPGEAFSPAVPRPQSGSGASAPAAPAPPAGLRSPDALHVPETLRDASPEPLPRRPASPAGSSSTGGEPARHADRAGDDAAATAAAARQAQVRACAVRWWQAQAHLCWFLDGRSTIIGIPSGCRLAWSGCGGRLRLLMGYLFALAAGAAAGHTRGSATMCSCPDSRLGLRASFEDANRTTVGIYCWG